MTDRSIYVCNHGGGLNSAVAEVMILERGMPIDLFIFADLHAEPIHTYVSLTYYKRLAEMYGVEFVVLNASEGRYKKALYDYLWDKKIVPSRMRRDCSTKFKKDEVRRYLRGRFGPKARFVQYLNYATDEAERIQDSDVKFIELKHILVDAKMTRDDCTRYLQKRGLPVPQKSGCYFCMMQPRDSWMALNRDNPEMVDMAIKLEQNATRYPVDTLYPNYTLKELVELPRGNKKIDEMLGQACGGHSGCWT